ncbi:hypothetical protein [Roseisolibacter sp. H3M3-2]|uniref:hypothetical protein n=1 Tax=Roseisolibacter sp. H3M3-2 TaxID=3031323 RepID=UPI0023DA5C74|nr:hypothetical protein [Roseisolibacter sp. H3M3-2]MDF1502442.1 hypothetical protein [Roseisolibacter sp. H3M3-2]
MSHPAAPAPTAALAHAREGAIRLLTDRYADDTLSTGEFESRLDLLYATETPAAVSALTADLVATRAVAAARPAAPAPAPLPARPSGDHVFCLFAERRLEGRWAPGPWLEVTAAFAEVTLDLRQADLGAGCEFEVHALFASVRVLLPPDATLDLQVGAVMGSVVDDTTLALGAGPRVKLRGMSAMAEVTVRRTPTELPPDAPFKLVWREARRAAKRARR